MTDHAHLEFAQNAAEVCRLDREQEKLGFITRQFASTSLPYKEPPVSTEVWWRRNGPLLLTVTPGKTVRGDGTVANLGFPFGSVPRLLLAWLSTAAVQRREPHLRLPSSMREFMRDLGMNSFTGGRKGSMSRFRNQTTRLLECTLSFKHEGDENRDVGGKLTVANSWHLWWTESDSPSPSWIRLSDEFFQMILAAPVPMSMHVMRLFQQHPVQMDLYWWLTYRLWRLDSPVTITWNQLSEQFGFQVAANRQGEYTFRKSITEALRRVLAVYHQANVEVTKHGLKLYPSRPHIATKAERKLLATS